MTGAHGLPHWHDGDSPLHRARPEVKVVAALGLVIAVVALPPRAPLAYAVPLLVVVALAAVAGVGPGTFLRRLLPVVPVLAFALLLPVFGRGPDIEVLGVSLSEPGLWAMGAILAKGVLGAAVMVVLSSTTEPVALLRGLRTLRVPAILVAIASFMVRFAVVVRGEARAMAVARASRGHRPRRVTDLAPIASAVGALFVRSFERGERVHAAMLSRGWTGTFPDDGPPPAP